MNTDEKLFKSIPNNRNQEFTPTASTGEETCACEQSQMGGGVYTSIQTHTPTDKNTDKKSFKTTIKTSINELERIDKITSPICVRVPVSYKLKYMELDHKRKHLFKLGVMGLIDALYNEKKASTVNTYQPMIFNININYAEANNTNTVNNKVEANISELVKIVQRLYALREPLPPLQRQLVETLYKKITKPIIN